MKDRTAVRFITIGILSGILISGIFLLILNLIQNTNERPLFTLSPLIQTTNENNPQSQSFVDEGKININTASIKDLMTLPGIGETKANAIIEFREKYGDFKEISEISYVAGIGNNLFESIQDMITIGNN